MATTIEQLEQTGVGAVVYLLEIPGCAVFTTYNYTPNDDWFLSSGYTADDVYPYLRHVELGPVGERLVIESADLDIDQITAVVTDYDNEISNLFKDFRATTYTRLITTMASTATTASVQATADFAASGELYCGQERMHYTSKDGDQTFAGITRALRNTAQHSYTVDLSVEPPLQPVVSASSHSIVGRRAILRSAVIDPATNLPGATSVIYRGIADRTRSGRGEYIIPIKHVWATSKEKIGQRLKKSTIPKYTYYFSGGGPSSRVRGRDREPGTANGQTLSFLVDKGAYNDVSLVDHLNVMFASEGGTVIAYLTWNEDKYKLTSGYASGYKLIIEVYEGDPLWALGFDAGTYEGGIGVAIDYDAQNEPRLLHIDTYHMGDPEINVDDTSVFEADDWVHVPGNYYGRIKTVGTTSVTLYSSSYDRVKYRDRKYWSVPKKQKDLVLKQGMNISNNTGVVDLKNALKRIFNLHPAQAVKREWCATGIEYADIDWDELDDALGSVPESLKNIGGFLTDPIEAWKYIGGHFAVIGIYPRITTDGKIGWKRLETPTSLDAITVELDRDVWSIDEASEILSRNDASPLLNLVMVEYDQDYTVGGKTGSLSGPIKIYWDDGLNVLGRTSSVKYSCPGFIVGSYRLPTEIDLATALNRQCLSMQFGVLARESVTLDIPCTWTSRQIKCGDIVKVTHEMAPDFPNGVTGMTDRLGICVGRSLEYTEGQGDMLSIRFGPDVPVKGIAPCAKGTVWSVSELRMTFSGADTPLYEQGSLNDLYRFFSDTSLVAVSLHTYGSTAGASYAATIATNGVATSTNTVVFATDPFGGAAMPAEGVYMVNTTWDLASSTQKEFCYIADNQITPSLGSGSDEAHEWGI